MDVIELQEKVREWERDKENCSTRTVKALMQEMVDSGHCLVRNYGEMLCVFAGYLAAYEEADKQMDEILRTGDINKLNNIYDEHTEDLLFRDEEELRNGVEELLDSFKDKSLDEIISFYDDKIKEAEEFNRYVKEKLLAFVQLQKDSLSSIAELNLLLYQSCNTLIEGAVEFHDYGQWEAAKELFKSSALNIFLSLNKVFEATEFLARVGDLFDKNKFRRNFYSSTEENIIKMEEQIEALKVANESVILLKECYSKMAE